MLTDRDYQAEGITWLVNKRRGILADEMGMGKSMQAIKAMSKYKLNSALILCPNSAVIVWLRELTKWLPEGHRYTKFTLVRGDRWTRARLWEQVNSDPENRFCLTTYDVFKRDIVDKDFKHLINTDWDFIICDEAHKMRNRKTKAFEAVSSLTSRGMILITGTPASRGPQDLWTLLNLLQPKIFKSYWRFVYAHCNVIDNGYGKEITGVKSPATTQALLEKYMLRRFKEGRMPPKVRNLVPVEMTDLQRKLYMQIAEELVARIEDIPDEDFNLEEGLKFGGWDDDDDDEFGEAIEGKRVIGDDGEIERHPSVIVAQNQLVSLIRLRQVLICPKIIDPRCDYGGGIEYIVDSLNEYGKEEQHVVIYTPFAKALPFLRERLEAEGMGPIIELRGGRRADPKGMREKLDLFEREKGIALCVIPFAQSFDLDSAKTGFFLGYEWDPELNFQAEDRQHRMRHQWTVTMNYLQYAGTVDDRLLDVNNEKFVTTRKFLRSKHDMIKILKGE